MEFRKCTRGGVREEKRTAAFIKQFIEVIYFALDDGEWKFTTMWVFARR